MTRFEIIRLMSTPSRFPITTTSKVNPKQLMKEKQVKHGKPSYSHMYNALINYKKALNIKYSN